MRYMKPDYYDEFRCIAGDCPATCCGSWKIMIDDETLDKYAALKGDLGAQIKNGIDWENDCFLPREDGCCRMLREDGLCTIQRACGEEMLCRTCDRYPRHEEEFENVREWSLSLSCPEAARMILGKGRKTTFISRDEETEDEEFEDYDPMMFSMLEDAREVLLRIAQDEVCPPQARAARILKFAGKLQDTCDENGIFAAEELIDQETAKADPGIDGPAYTEQGLKAPDTKEFQEFLTEDMAKEWLEELYELELLRDDWEGTLDETMSILFGAPGLYTKVSRIFEKTENSKLSEAGRRIYQDAEEEILVTFLYTYFCGAVYDEYIYSKAALAVYSYVVVRLMAMAQWAKDPGSFGLDDMIKLTYRYAREIEHSDENLGSLMTWLDEQRI